MKTNLSSVEVQWVAVSDTDLSWNDACLAKYFSVTPHQGLLTQFDMPISSLVIPRSLKPRDGFHRLTSKNITGAWTGDVSRTPYLGIQLTANISADVTSVTVDLFPGGTLIARVKAKIELNVPFSFDEHFAEISNLRSARNNPAIDAILRSAISLAHGRRSRTSLQEVQYSDYFAVKLTMDHDRADFETFITGSRREIAALLIGTRNPSSLTENVVENVFERSSALNEKAQGELLLLNSQGMVYLLPDGKYSGPHLNRFDRTVDLAIIALFARKFLDDSNGFHSRWPVFSLFLTEKLRRWILKAPLIFSASVSNTLAWETLSSTLSLPDRYTERSTQYSSFGDDQNVRRTISSIQGEWWLVPNLELLLQNDSKSGSAELGFISNEHLRLFIEADRNEATRCLSTGNFRAASVMAGAAIEGILLALLLDSNPAEKDAYLALAMDAMIEKCCPRYREKLNKNDPIPARLIGVDTASMLSTSSRKWRNYIHPGLAMRTDSPASREVADAAIASLNLLLQDVGRRAASAPATSAGSSHS